MVTLLSDHNCEGHAVDIFHALQRAGYVDLFDITLLNFQRAGLDKKATDEEVWLFCQANGYLLITGNRTMSDEDESLEAVMSRLSTAQSLPVFTIGDLMRVTRDPVYCTLCAEAIGNALLDGEDMRGRYRIWIPGQL